MMKRVKNLYLYELGQSKWMLLFAVIVCSVLQIGMHIFDLLRFTNVRAENLSAFEIDTLVQGMNGVALSLMAAFMILFFQSLYMWGKEWRGQGTMIYRLLQLPGNRVQVFVAKFLTMLTIVWMLEIFQYIVIGVNLLITMGWIQGLEGGLPYFEVIASNSVMKFILPTGGVTYVWFAMMKWAVISTWFVAVIIVEGLKAFGWRRAIVTVLIYSLLLTAIVIGFGYCVIMVLRVTEFEQVMLITVFSGLVFVANTMIASRLLNHHVSV